MPAPLFPILPEDPSAEPETLSPNKQHVAHAFSRLLDQFKDKARLKKLIEILLRPFQELDDVVWDFYINRRLDTAIGAQLDLIGKIVKEKRNGLADEDYRSFLRIKIRVLLSRGTGPDIMQICTLILGLAGYTYKEYFPAAQVVEVLSSPTFDLTILKRFLVRAKAGGTRLDLVDGSGGLGVRFHYGSEGTGVGYGVGTYGSII